MSIRWEGYIKPSFTEAYVVSVVTNDGARLWIQNELLFDAFDDDIDVVDGSRSAMATTTTMEFKSNATPSS